MAAIITQPHIDCYSHVPKDTFANLIFRRVIRERALRDPGYRRGLRTACREDFLFFLNSFAWLYEPRKRFDATGKILPKKIPFLTRPHQDRVFTVVRKNLGVCDIGVEKSRDEGASWMAVWLAMQDWCFQEYSNIGMVSKSEEAVYKAKAPGSLFWKIDFAVESLPDWITGIQNKTRGWDRNYSENTLTHAVRKNVISGFAATGTAATGDRTDWFFFDELSKFPRPEDATLLESLNSVTDGILAVGTPFGSTGAYYDIMHKPSNIVKVRLIWSENPVKNRGLYRMVRGIPQANDPINNPLPKEYDPPAPKTLEMFERLRKKGFDLNSGDRSPWYDLQCDRAGSTPVSIAQELDVNYGGSIAKWFGEEFKQAAEKVVCDPIMEGELRHDEELEPSFSRITGGKLKLWCQLDALHKPPPGKYCLGCDVGSGFVGNYTSNSTIIVVSLDTQEQVAELATNSLHQTEFADLAISMAKWFHNAMLGWEFNYASGFTERVIERKYPNVWERPVLGKKRKRRKRRGNTGPDLGWWTDGRKTKPLMFNDIDYFVRTNRIVLKSGMILSEALCYVISERNSPEYEGYEGDESHGDRVIGFGVCCEIAKQHFIKTGAGGVKKRKKVNPAQARTEAIERMFTEEDRAKVKSDWDNRTPADLVGDSWYSEASGY